MVVKGVMAVSYLMCPAAAAAARALASGTKKGGIAQTLSGPDVFFFLIVVKRDLFF